MAAIEFPLPRTHGITIVAEAVRVGEFRCKSANETIAANLCVAQRYLTRDLKDGNLFRPGEHAIGMLDRARELGKLPAVDPETGSNSKVALLRDPATINSDDRLRDLGEGTVLALMDAFQRVGQHQPIEVFGKSTDAIVKLGAGGHRLEACRRLGIKVLCFHYEGDELDRQLCEIDENLIREDLSPADRALFMARRKEIYLIKHPETAHGGDRKSSGQNDHLKTDAPKRFTAATAEATGQDERTIRRDVERGEKISPMALQMLRSTAHNKGVVLDKIKRLKTAEAQENFVRELIASDKAIAAKSKQIRTAQQAVNRQSRMQMVNLLARHSRKAGEEMPRAAYPVGYADPPWQQEAWDDETGQDKGLRYPSMTVDEIKSLCAGDKSPFTRDAVLFLWVTANRLPDGLAVLEAWGFQFVTSLVWDKVNIGMGRWSRDKHESLFIGKRGSISLAPLPGTQPPSLYSEAKTEHSRKPVWYAEQIDRLWPDLQKLELFQRKDSLAPDDVRLNGKWEFWGNQAGTPEGGAE